MSDVLPPEEAGIEATIGDPEAAADLDMLREILVGTGHLEIERVKERLDDPEQRAKEVADVIARAIVIRSSEDGQLAAAMRPTIEDTLEESVRKNPQAIVDVIFPIIGPAIRKAISSSINSMVASLNRTVESAFTFRGLKWRMQAWRSGKSYAEIALAHNLVYRVEQVFLMHRGDGLLISHVTYAGEAAQEPEVISGMLTAIRDFVHDSLSVEEGSSVDAFRVGDLNLMVAPGSNAVLAAVVRGIPPPTLREDLQSAVETVHADYQAPLHAFDGDTEQFAGVDAVLEECLGEERKTQKKRGASSYIFWGVIVTGLFALIAWWVVSAMRAGERADAWGDYVAALRSEPGYVITHATGPGDELVVQGLRDPRARSPEALLEGIDIAQSDIRTAFTPHHSSHPPFVLGRLNDALAPLPTVTLALEGGVLTASGRAGQQWLDDLRRSASLTAGVERIDTSAVVPDSTLDELTRLLDAARAWTWGVMDVSRAGEAAYMAAIVLELLAKAAKDARLDVRVQVVLYGDDDAGTQLANALFERLQAKQLPVTGWTRGERGDSGLPAYIGLVATVRDRGS